jgi:hypothetical protein
MFNCFCRAAEINEAANGLAATEIVEISVAFMDRKLRPAFGISYRPFVQLLLEDLIEGGRNKIEAQSHLCARLRPAILNSPSDVACLPSQVGDVLLLGLNAGIVKVRHLTSIVYRFDQKVARSTRSNEKIGTS